MTPATYKPSAGTFKTFNGKRYRVYDEHFSKRDAQAEQAELRKLGYLCRIARGVYPGVWLTYVRKK